MPTFPDPDPKLEWAVTVLNREKHGGFEWSISRFGEAVGHCRAQFTTRSAFEALAIAERLESEEAEAEILSWEHHQGDHNETVREAIRKTGHPVPADLETPWPYEFYNVRMAIKAGFVDLTAERQEDGSWGGCLDIEGGSVVSEWVTAETPDELKRRLENRYHNLLFAMGGPDG